MRANGKDRRRLPPAMRGGFVVLGLGLVLDLAYHAVLLIEGGHAPHSGVVATSVHALVLAGMATTFGGLLRVGLRRQGFVDGKERK